MKRRELLLLLGGALMTARGLRAQQKAMSVIGFLSSGSPGPFAPLVAAFRQGLSETGYVEGQTVAIEYRWAEGSYDRLPALAADLVGRKVDVIAASGGPLPALAAKSATSTIPIVFSTAVDPVKAGLVASLNRPGGNVTGMFFDFPGYSAKLLELLAEAKPGLTRIAVLWDPSSGPIQIEAAEAAAAARGPSGSARSTWLQGQYAGVDAASMHLPHAEVNPAPSAICAAASASVVFPAPGSPTRTTAPPARPNGAGRRAVGY